MVEEVDENKVEAQMVGMEEVEGEMEEKEVEKEEVACRRLRWGWEWRGRRYRWRRKGTCGLRRQGMMRTWM